MCKVELFKKCLCLFNTDTPNMKPDVKPDMKPQPEINGTTTSRLALFFPAASSASLFSSTSPAPLQFTAVGKLWHETSTKPA